MTEFETEPNESTIPLLSLLRMVWKQARLVALVTVILSAAIIPVVYKKIPVVYRAETLILVDSQKIPEKFVSSTVESPLQDRIASLSQQILSSTRLLRIIDEHNLYAKQRMKMTREELVERMRGDIEVTVEKGFSKDSPGAFRVSYQGNDARTVAAVTNQLGGLFVEENFRAREVQAEGTTDFLRSQLTQAKKSLDEQEARVSSYKLRHNGELPQQEQALTATLNQLRVQLQGHQDAISRAYQNKVALQNSLEAVLATQETLSRMEESSARAAAAAAEAVMRPTTGPQPQKRSTVMEAELAVLRQRMREEHPDIQAAKARIAAQKALERQEALELEQLEKERESEQPKRSAASEAKRRRIESTPEQRQKVAALRAQIEAVQKEIDSRQEDVGRVSREIQSVEARLGSLPVREQEMAALTRDYETSKANYKSLLDKSFAADMATEMERRQQSERFTVLDRAHVPEKPAKPYQKQMMAAGGVVFSLVLGLLIALGLELRKGCLLGEWELPSHVAVLGTVQYIELTEFDQVGTWKVWAVAASSILLGAAAAGLYLIR